MAGVYTENQPDFTWLMPFEEKSFTQYFLPYRELGIVKNASKDILLNIDPAGDAKVNLKVFATSEQTVTIKVATDGGKTIAEQTLTLSPEKIYDEVITVGDAAFDTLNVVITDNTGRELLTWHAEPADIRPIPDSAEAALRPDEIKTVEQLFLTGQHLEQYRHATFNPVEYYEEGLRRDPMDVRCNNALGLWYIRKGRFDIAEKYLRTAVKVITRRNPNPYDGEPIFNLGLALRFQGKYSDAYDRFYKSTWNAAWQDAGYMACAQISSLQGRLDDALYEVDRSLIRNWHNHVARALKANILNHMGRKDDALKCCADALEIDPFNFGCLYEAGKIDEMRKMMRADANDYDQVALDYMAAGCWQDAVNVWNIAIEENAVTPMTRYYMAYCLLNNGNEAEAKAMYQEAAKVSPDFCFPNRLEAILALNEAMRINPDDANAPYYLGNLYYDKRQYDLAISLWRKSSELNPDFPTVWRNLALATFNKLGDSAAAVEMMECAFALDTDDARILMELDQLYKRLGRDHAERLAFLEKYPELIKRRDDLLLEQITLLNLTGNYRRAIELLDSHIFHPWEGGEGKVPAQYQYSRVELAKEAIAAGNPAEAVKLLEECLVYPHHLGEGKLHGALDNDFLYLLGQAYEALGQHDKAVEAWTTGTAAPLEPAAALYYNDAAPDKLFYAGLCELALGNTDKARGRFNRLITYGEQHIFDDVKPDYFAVSLPDLLIWESDLNTANQVHCRYMMALGHYGMGNTDKARTFLASARALNCNHTGINAFASFMK